MRIQRTEISSKADATQVATKGEEESMRSLGCQMRSGFSGAIFLSSLCWTVNLLAAAPWPPVPAEDIQGICQGESIAESIVAKAGERLEFQISYVPSKDVKSQDFLNRPIQPSKKWEIGCEIFERDPNLLSPPIQFVPFNRQQPHKGPLPPGGGFITHGPKQLLVSPPPLRNPVPGRDYFHQWITAPKTAGIYWLRIVVFPAADPSRNGRPGTRNMGSAAKLVEAKLVIEAVPPSQPK